MANIANSDIPAAPKTDEPLIYLRVCGQIIGLTSEEWDKRFPPMSLDACSD